MTLLRNLKNSLGTLLVIGLTLLVSFFAIRSLAMQGTQPAAGSATSSTATSPAAVDGPVAQVWATTTPPGQNVEQIATPTMLALSQPSSAFSAPATSLQQCSFPLSNVLAVENDVPNIENYVFSEPKTILTNKFNLHVVQWVSDKEVLILRSTMPNLNLESIEILNINNGETVKLAEGKFADIPLWNSTQRAVTYLQYDEAEKKWNLMWQKVSEDASKIESDVRLPVLLLGAKNGAMAYSESQKGLLGKVVSQNNQEKKWAAFEAYKAPIPTPFEWVYKTAISPDEHMQVVYNIEHFLIFSNLNDKVSEFSLGEWQGEKRWALDAHWSPDSSLLVMNTTIGRLPNPYSSLLVMNIENKCLWEINISHPFYVRDIAWSPTGRYLLLSGEIGATQEGYSITEYRLFDLVTEQERRVNLWEAQMGGIYFDWSPDGKMVAINCATPEQNSLCAIAVEEK